MKVILLALIVCLIGLLVLSTEAYAGPLEPEHAHSAYELAVAAAGAVTLFGGAAGVLVKPWRTLVKRVEVLEAELSRHADHLGLRSEVDVPLRARVDQYLADRQAYVAAVDKLERAAAVLKGASDDA